MNEIINLTSIYKIISKQDKKILMLFTTDYFDEYTCTEMGAKQRWYVVDLIHVGRWEHGPEIYPLVTTHLVHVQRMIRYEIGRGQWTL